MAAAARRIANPVAVQSAGARYSAVRIDDPDLDVDEQLSQGSSTVLLDGAALEAGAEPPWLFAWSPTTYLVLQSPRIRASAAGLLAAAGILLWVGSGGAGPLSTYFGQKVKVQNKDGVPDSPQWPSSAAFGQANFTFVPVDGNTASPQDSHAAVAALPQGVDAAGAVPPPPPVPPPSQDRASSSRDSGLKQMKEMIEDLEHTVAAQAAQINKQKSLIKRIQTDADQAVAPAIVTAAPPSGGGSEAVVEALPQEGDGHDEGAVPIPPLAPPPPETVPVMREAAGGLRKPMESVCGGSIELVGWGSISLVNAAYNTKVQKAGRVEGDGHIWPHMTGRTYFGTACNGGPYKPQEYAALKLLGRSLRYTVDLSGADCGCNAALYLTSLPQNPDPSDCGDFYCDANEVCGVRCAEIDIQEANKWSWLTTLHTADDGGGSGGGYGADRSTWNSSQYGPGARCIDTRMPFSVTTSFPVDEGGMLQAVKVELTQPGKPCSVSMSLDNYSPFGGSRNGLAELTEPLKAGMTPIISYWGMDEDISWMDGRGPSGQGPCDDGPNQIAACADMVKFSDFALL